MTTQHTDFTPSPESGSPTLITNVRNRPPDVTKEIVGGRLETSSDVINQIESGLERFSEEDRRLISEYSKLVAYAYVTHKNREDNTSVLATVQADSVIEEMSPQAREHVETDSYKRLLTRLSNATRRESY